MAVQMKIEITSELGLTKEQQSILIAHSFVNIVNVLKDNFTRLRKTCRWEKFAENSMRCCQELEESFRSEEKTAYEIEQAQKHLDTFRDDLAEIAEAVASNSTFSPETRREVDARISNIESVLSIFIFRAREAMARKNVWRKWVYLPFDEIKGQLCDFLEATEKNSMGNFCIAYDMRDKKEKDYLVEFDFKSADGGDECLMPSYMPDTIRDLVANARKYGHPGGRIGIKLVDDGKTTTLEISDDGMGIPENEIESVVGFGKRGSNTAEDQKKGCGCGLTKAYFLCKSFKGRMWVDSEESKSTTVTVAIPHPAPDAA